MKPHAAAAQGRESKDCSPSLYAESSLRPVLAPVLAHTAFSSLTESPIAQLSVAFLIALAASELRPNQPFLVLVTQLAYACIVFLVCFVCWSQVWVCVQRAEGVGRHDIKNETPHTQLTDVPVVTGPYALYTTTDWWLNVELWPRPPCTCTNPGWTLKTYLASAASILAFVSLPMTLEPLFWFLFVGVWWLSVLMILLGVSVRLVVKGGGPIK